jgi:hypothetical protein
VQVLAVDRDQAKVCFGYCQAFLEQPMLKRLVRRETADTIELSNCIAIEVTTNDRRRVRGRTVVAAILRGRSLALGEHAEPGQGGLQGRQAGDGNHARSTADRHQFPLRPARPALGEA